MLLIVQRRDFYKRFRKTRSAPSISSSEVPRIYWAPIPYSWPYPSKKTPARRRPREIRKWGLLSSIVGRIDFYLKGGRTEAPREGTAGWLAKNLRFFAKHTEKYSVEDFLKKYSKFLSVTGHKNILLLEMDYEQIYADRDNKDPDDLHEALARAYEYIAHNPRSNKILVSTFARSRKNLRNDLDLSVEAQYYRRHGGGKPSIEVRVLGIPSLLAKQHLESRQHYKTRIKKLFRELRSNAEKERFARKYENMLKTLLRDYELHLKGIFDVAKTIRWMRIEWGRIEQDPMARARV